MVSMRVLAVIAMMSVTVLGVGALPSAPPLSPAAKVGEKMFFDRSLSASGQLACASCHDPEHAHASPNGFAVQIGGKHMNLPGTRAVPSLNYTEATPPYADLLDNPDGISQPGPGGGYTQDGRAATLAEQAQIPLLSKNEMANASPAQVVARLRKAGYADQFRAAFGADIFKDDKAAFSAAMQALQAYQLEDVSFHPYDSKYDLYAGNKIGGDLTAQEMRGFAVYADPNKGNCFACHYNGAGLNGSVRLFTDFTYAAIGVPRNMAIPANRDPRYYDLGICARPDHNKPDDKRFCGMFKTPTLRNVATRKVFFHNGQLKSLRDVIRFYNTRDTQPELWYPTKKGKVQKFNDLPEQYRANIDTQAPLDGKKVGAAGAMTEQDMEDLEAFLNTLTDHYKVPPQPPKPAKAPKTAAIASDLHP